MVAATLIPLRVAALRIRFTPERTLRLLTTGKLVGQRIGARYYVSAEDLSRFERERALSLHVGSPMMAGVVR